MPKRKFIFLVLTLLHAVVSYGLHAWSVTLIMEVAYRGRAETFLDETVHFFSALLSLPLVSPFVRYLYMQTPDSLAVLVFLLNSMIWVAGIWLLLKFSGVHLDGRTNLTSFSMRDIP